MNKFLLLLLCMSGLIANAQNVGIGTKKPLSKLHVAGDLRVDSLAAQHTKGLVIHDQAGVLRSLELTGNKNDLLRGDGSFSSSVSSTSWLTSGNAGIDSLNSFLGTTDDRPLRFVVFGRPAGTISAQTGTLSYGLNSLASNTFGQSNTAVGTGALQSNTTGNNNTALGLATLSRMVEGINNTAVGTGALTEALGEENTAFGSFALQNLTTGNYNTAIGHLSLGLQKNGYGNIAIGSRSQQSAQETVSNIAIGFNAMAANKTVSELIAIGAYSLLNSTTGIQNQGVGSYSLYTNSSGSGNLAEGFYSMHLNSTGSFNTALGAKTLFNNTVASRNTAIGYEAMYTNTLGASNVAIGARAFYFNKFGHSSIAIGDSAMIGNHAGFNNTAIGERVMFRNNNGNGNVALGFLALSVNTSGSNNTALGNGADVTSGNFTNATAVGYNAKVNASNKVRIGNASVTKIEGQVPFTTPSDGRFKFNVQENVAGLDFVMRLRPVTYQFDVKRFDGIGSNEYQVSYDRATAMRRTGFIAQEVKKAADEAGYDFSGISIPENADDHYSLSYESFVVPLVKGMQEQQVTIARQGKQLRSLEEKLIAQQELITKLIGEIETLKNDHASKQ